MHQIGASPLPQEQGFNALVLCGVQRHLIKSCVEAVGQNKRKKDGEKPKVVTRLRGPHYHSASKFLTTTLIVFPVLILFTAWKMKAITLRI
ncbi:hypothetical protein PR048_031001 [Dryococelus australis]|uniref:Uncharacterized protein n=1 Tax=Dryococelus australis TaxID=614101 RepID=A0ABQ9G6X5_9NEOP|nr:hypothetical protein PR048_031001 [Dryococelus australis]